MHHIPYAREILRQACARLRPDGECRVTLYTAKRWRDATGTEPPEKVWEHEGFGKYVRLDAVGTWSDWYDEERAAKLVEEFGEIVETQLLYDGHLLGVVIKARGS